MISSVVRTTRARNRLDEWALVLSSAGIAHRVSSSDGVHHLLVDSGVADIAISALREYDRERTPPGGERWQDDVGTARLAWIAAAFILGGHILSGPVSPHSVWFTAGAARAVAIRSGQLWRCITALTLHANMLHALSNTASALLFLAPLCRMLGGGTAIALTLLAGALATLVNAFIRGAGYSGIGASTAIFAAVGLLAALQTHDRPAEPVWRRFRAAGAALGILAMLGAAPSTDVTAHLLGLVTGYAVGIAFTRYTSQSLSTAADRVLGIASLASIAIAWVWALAAALP